MGSSAPSRRRRRAGLPTDAFACFVGDGPGSAASIRDGLNWLASAEPGGKPGLIFIATLDVLRHPSHVHEMLGKASVQKLLDERGVGSATAT